MSVCLCSVILPRSALGLSVILPRSALGLSVFRDCVSISKSYSLVVLLVIFTFRGVYQCG